MSVLPAALALLQAGESLPPGASAADHAFAFGAIVLLVVLILRQGRGA